MHGAVTLHLLRSSGHGQIYLSWLLLCEWGRLHDEELYAVYLLPNIIVVMK